MFPLFSSRQRVKLRASRSHDLACSCAKPCCAGAAAASCCCCCSAGALEEPENIPVIHLCEKAWLTGLGSGLRARIGGSLRGMLLRWWVCSHAGGRTRLRRCWSRSNSSSGTCHSSLHFSVQMMMRGGKHVRLIKFV